MARSQSTPELRRIGTAIRDIRERRGETQVEVADRSKISVDHYRDIENGRQRARRATYMRIATALEIDHDEMDRITGMEVEVA